MNIDGMGDEIIRRFYELGMIRDVSDIYKLKRGKILELERFGEKSADNLLASIDASKNSTLARFINALGIRNVGEQTARDLASHFGTIEKMMDAGEEELQNIFGIGEKVAKSLTDFFSVSVNKKIIRSLLDTGIILQAEVKKEGALSGKTFLFTGTLEKYTRGAAEEKVLSLGGSTLKSVTKKLNYLVVGGEPGSKLEKARKLGVNILNEADFLKLIGE